MDSLNAESTGGKLSLVLAHLRVGQGAVQQAQLQQQQQAGGGNDAVQQMEIGRTAIGQAVQHLEEVNRQVLDLQAQLVSEQQRVKRLEMEQAGLRAQFRANGMVSLTFLIHVHVFR